MDFSKNYDGFGQTIIIFYRVNKCSIFLLSLYEKYSFFFWILVGKGLGNMGHKKRINIGTLMIINESNTCFMIHNWLF